MGTVRKDHTDNQALLVTKMIIPSHKSIHDTSNTQLNKTKNRYCPLSSLRHRQERNITSSMLLFCALFGACIINVSAVNTYRNPYRNPNYRPSAEELVKNA